MSVLQEPLPDWPVYSDEEIEAVCQVLSSGKVNYWTGSITKIFEKEFAGWCQATHAIAVANGTVALQLCIMGLGVGSHFGGHATDEIIVTPRSFVASASVIVISGAKPVFVDICPDSQNIDPQKVCEALTDKTKAILCVHHAGWPCDIDAIREVIGSRDIKIIEDCAQAHGAFYKGQPVGSLGDVAAWSFCQDKIISTGGEGGMVTCNSKALWQRMWSYKDHGKDYELTIRQHQYAQFRWLHTKFGSNFRLTEMQSAIGRLQLAKLPEWANSRNRNAQILADAFTPLCGQKGPIRIPQPKCSGCVQNCHLDHPKSGCQNAFYRFYIFVKEENLAAGWSRDRLVEELKKRFVPCMQGSCPEIYREASFEAAGLQPDRPLTSAAALGAQSIAFLVHPTLEDRHMTAIASEVVGLFERARRLS